jgi:hypothetical protein
MSHIAFGRKSMTKYGACFLLGCSVMHAAYCAHPLLTDDTNTQGTGRHQVEINTDLQQFSNERSHVVGFTYTYGVRQNVDAFIALPMTVSFPFGANDLSLGSKWRFSENENGSLAIKPELFLPTGNANDQLGNGRVSFALTLLGSYQLDPWTFHANAGVLVNRYSVQTVDDANRSVVWRISAAAEYALNDQWKLVSEVGVARNLEKASGVNPAFFLAGFIYSPDKSTDIDVGAKFGLNRAEMVHQLGVGVTLRF